MAYQATVIPTMIASPSDVLAERDIIRDAIHNWNYIHSTANSLIVMPVGWDTHSTPELSGRPQGIINKRLLDNCDLVVAVFWTRIGSPTGEEESGTVEEIMRHHQAGKPVMVYFCKRPASLDTVDPDQYQKLKRFIEKCKGLGLIHEFENLPDLKDKFSNHLQIIINTNEYIAGIKNEFNVEYLPELDSLKENSGNIIDISEEAKSILVAASRDDDGVIFKLSFIGGRYIEAGGMKFGGQSGRENAMWERALSELESNGLIIGRGYKGETFELTDDGWRLADKIKSVP